MTSLTSCCSRTCPARPPARAAPPHYALLDATIGQRPGDATPSHNLFYDCAADPDRLKLKSTLRRNGAVLFTRGPETHWWLTGFKWGVLSDPSQLSMDVAITLKDAAMRDAFLGGIAGRAYPNLNVSGTTVSFTFNQPFAVPQPPRAAPVLAAVNAANLQIVTAYDALGFPSNDPNVVQADFLSVAGLGLLHLADHFGQTVCRLAVDAGQSLSSIVTAVAGAFSIAAGTVEGWLSSASRAFATWVDAIEDYLGLPLHFSCYVEIDNSKGASSLVLENHAAAYGTYVVGPPSWIAPGAVARLVLQDPKPSWFGSEGTVTYRYCDADLRMKSVAFSYSCPTGFNANTASSSQPNWKRFAKSSDPHQAWSTAVPAGGHPLYVDYVNGGGPPTSGTLRRVTRVRKNPEGDLTHLCGAANAGWGPVPVADAIAQIRSGAAIYVASAGGTDAAVHVVKDPDGPYLRTVPDASPANNLDALPGC